MNRTQYYCASSLDGYIAEADDTIGWLVGYEGRFDRDHVEHVEPVEDAYDRYYAGVGALAMGSATYEFILSEMAGGGEWPYKGKPTWVFTSRDLPRPDGDDVDVRIANAPVSELHEEMIDAAGERDLWIVGGGNVAFQFADEGLLDAVIVTMVPVVLGDGKPLFDRRLADGPMQLTGTRTFDNGMVELSYEIER